MLDHATCPVLYLSLLFISVQLAEDLNCSLLDLAISTFTRTVLLSGVTLSAAVILALVLMMYSTLATLSMLM